MPSPLPVEAPFHLEATVRLLQRRPANPVNVLDEGCFQRAFAAGRGLVLAQVANAGTIDAPELWLAVAGPAMPAERARLRSTLRRMLGLDVDPAGLARLAEVDPRLAPIAAALRGARPPRFASLFETFANVVPFQQVSLDAGVAIAGRLVRKFGRKVEAGGGAGSRSPRPRTSPRPGRRRCGRSA